MTLLVTDPPDPPAVPPDSAADAPDVAAWRRLGAGGWRVIPAARLPAIPAAAAAETRRLVLLHPGIGMVILDLRPDPPPAAGALRPEEAEARRAARQRLATLMQEVERMFGGLLPVRHLALAEPELPGLARLLERAFAGAPPPGGRGEAWVAALQQALRVSAAPRDPPAVARPGPAPPARRWSTVAAAMGGIGAVALGWLVLGGWPALRPDPAGGIALRAAEAGEAAPQARALPLEAWAVIDIADTASAAPSPEPEASSRTDAGPLPDAAGTRGGIAAPLLPDGPLPEPDMPRLAPLAGPPDPGATDERHAVMPEAAVGTALSVVEPLPEPEAPRLPPLDAAPPAGALAAAPPAPPAAPAEPDAPHPAPPAVTPGGLAPDISLSAAPPVEPLPEPEAPRLPPLDAAPPAGALAAAPPAPTAAPAEPDAPHPAPPAVTPGGLAPDISLSAAPPVEPLPEPEAPRLPPLDAAPPAGALAAAPPAPPAAPAEPDAPVVAAPLAPSEPPAPRRPSLDPRVVAMLVARGEALMANGDISGARLLYARAAEAGSVAAAMAMGRSFDPEVLAGLGAVGIAPDPAQAAHWYRRAAELGAPR